MKKYSKLTNLSCRRSPKSVPEENAFKAFPLAYGILPCRNIFFNRTFPVLFLIGERASLPYYCSPLLTLRSSIFRIFPWNIPRNIPRAVHYRITKLKSKKPAFFSSLVTLYLLLKNTRKIKIVPLYTRWKTFSKNGRFLVVHDRVKEISWEP